MNFSEQIVYAMFKPSKYKEMIKLKRSRFVGFTVVLMLVLGIVTFVVPTGAYITGFGGFKKLFLNKMGELHFNDGVLSIERPFEMSIEGVNIIINTDSETVPDEELRNDSANIALGSKNIRMVISVNGNLYEYQNIPLTNILPEGLDNEKLTEFIPGIYLWMFLVFIVTCVGFFIKYGFMALLFSIIINSMNNRMKLGLSFGQVFSICFYGQTFAMILVNFNSAIGLLPAILVSIVGIFITVNTIVMSVALMNQGNKV